MSDERIPMLRPIEVVSVTHEGQDLFLMRDPQGIAAEPLLLPPASALLLRFFDGQHSLRDIQAALLEITGQILPSEQIRGFVDKLDRHLFLDSERYKSRREEMAREYASSPVRPAMFAGKAYSADRATLMEDLNQGYETAGGPGLPAHAVSHPPAAVVAPHIDPGRGAAVYAKSYAPLWGARPRRVVVLGVCHGGGSQPFIVSSKDFETPLGTARTDRELLGRLLEGLDWNPLEEEDLHRWEHSIEFQIVHLQHALSQGGDAAPEPEPSYLPILCSFPWQVFLPASAGSELRGRVDRFLSVLGEIVREDAGGTLVVAGVDLAHMGRRFGDSWPAYRPATWPPYRLWPPGIATALSPKSFANRTTGASAVSPHSTACSPLCPASEERPQATSKVSTKPAEEA
ncbi:AmmeMemoRadiSam system protein B [Candidatus Eisenbacteria bacterium]|uniref:AmmeMemoRadiSam system protein B n=1 Tax=Eiseniibacteriota bacterium TaxID=2212470 RepID=A0ABV6YLA5_UNCEI